MPYAKYRLVPLGAIVPGATSLIAIALATTATRNIAQSPNPGVRGSGAVATARCPSGC